MTLKKAFSATTATFVTATMLSTLAGPAAALAPLSQNKYINDRLFAVAVGDEIRKNCPSIHARLIHVARKAKELEKYAKGLGYSEAQIDAYLGSKPDQAKMRARRDAYLKENGVKPGDKQSYCALGRAEMDKKSLIGSLLWSW